jgi:hypothetical protein
LNLQFIISPDRFPLSMANENNLQQRMDAAHCDDCGVSASGHGSEELRCACGNLIARLVAGRVELKCRRCKRTIMLPVTGKPEHGKG